MALLVIFPLIVAFASLLASPTLYASSTPDGGFKAMLKHVDYARRLTSNEHFQLALQRSKVRVESHKPRTNDITGGRIAPRDGEYFMNLSIGTPPRPYLALIDADTDLIWTTCEPTMQCPANGKKCSKFKSPIYDSRISSTYTELKCNSPQCGLTANTSCNIKHNSCNFKYQYSAGIPSFTEGALAIETFQSSSLNRKDSFRNLIFGCAHTISSDFGDLGSGFVGLGRGNMSLVSQMNVTMFSLCLPSYDKPNKTGAVAFGERAKIKTKKAVITDMLQNSLHKSSYYISLKGIKVNGKSLAIGNSPFNIDESGGGGIVMDTGMTVSYLTEDVYNKLTEKLTSLINLPMVKSVADVSLSHCYKMPKDIHATKVVNHLPTIAFTFGNGNNQNDLVLPVGNAFRSYKDSQNNNVSCLAMAAAPATDGRSSLGNIQLQDTLVVYDLAAKKISFIPDTPCDKQM